MAHPRAGMALLFASLALSLGFVVSSCGDDEPTGCRRAIEIPLMQTPLTTMPHVRLERVGANFALIGWDEASSTLRFASLDTAGTVGRETTMKVPARAIGPWYSLAGKSAPGDQLLVVIGVLKGNQLELQALTLDAGATAPSAAKRLVDGAGKDLVPAGAPMADLRVAMGSSKTGLRAALAWGFQKQNVAPKSIVLKADAELHSGPTDARSAPADWDCLAVTASRADFGISVTGRPKAAPEKATWYIQEFRDDGGQGYALNVGVPTESMSCPVVSPSAKGYVIGWQTSDGTYYADIDMTKPDNIPVNAQIVKGAVRFGGPQKQPPLACVAAMEKDFGIAYAAPTGPQVDRFDFSGAPKGRSLYLPVTHGAVGTVSAVPDVNALLVTYLDQRGTGGDAGATDLRDVRYFIKVTCDPGL